MSSVDKINEARLANAWECIMDQFFDLCVSKTAEHGGGISLFKMLPKREKNKSEQKINCAYNYITTGSFGWKAAIGPFKDEIVKQYDPEKHVLISVHVPTETSHVDTIGSTRLFSNEKNNPVEIML